MLASLLKIHFRRRVDYNISITTFGVDTTENEPAKLWPVFCLPRVPSTGSNRQLGERARGQRRSRIREAPQPGRRPGRRKQRVEAAHQRFAVEAGSSIRSPPATVWEGQAQRIGYTFSTSINLAEHLGGRLASPPPAPRARAQGARPNRMLGSFEPKFDGKNTSSWAPFHSLPGSALLRLQFCWNFVSLFFAVFSRVSRPAKEYINAQK